MAEGEMETPQSADSTGVPSKDEKTWGMVSHLAALSGLVTCGLGLIVGPLVVWLMKREKMPFVNDQGKEALNFQITAFAAWVVCLLASFFIHFFIIRRLHVVIGIGDIVLTVMAAIKANDGVAYRYPFAIRLIK